MKEYIVKADFITEGGELVFPDIVSELIRCKDCEHLKVSGELEHTSGDTTFYYICDYWHRATDEWRYCDEGARRNEDEELRNMKEEEQ